jgi:glucose/arabinose dehydrogenase
LAGASVIASLAVGLAAASASPGARDYRFRALFTALAPVHLAAPPGALGRLYVVQQGGRILVAVDGRLQAKPFLDLGRIVRSGGEQGLLSIAFHPGFARNGLFYVDYTGLDGNTRVVEYRAAADGKSALPNTARRILLVRQPGPEHNGGQLAFGPDGKLYVGMGDGECCDDPANRAQDLDQLLGKLLRLDARARSPVPEIAALGVRNPWRFSFDRVTRDLYVADVGAGAWEEVDYLPRATLGQLVNFGWDTYEGNDPKDDTPLNPAGRLVYPIQAYDHDQGDCSITGGFVYRGSAVPAARGRYFYGDYCTGNVWSLRVEAGAANDVRREPFRIPGLSTFGEDAAGELYAASETTGRVYKLVS